jgi:hypothetical protein
VFLRELCDAIGTHLWCHSEGGLSSRETFLRHFDEVLQGEIVEHSLTISLHCAFKIPHLSLVACLVESVLVFLLYLVRVHVQLSLPFFPKFIDSTPLRKP